MFKEEHPLTVEELLAKAKKPAAAAMVLHPLYCGKVETVPRCAIRDFHDFAIWYTPGVAEPCKAIAKDPELVYEYTNKWNTVPERILPTMDDGEVFPQTERNFMNEQRSNCH